MAVIDTEAKAECVAVDAAVGYTCEASDAPNAPEEKYSPPSFIKRGINCEDHRAQILSSANAEDSKPLLVGTSSTSLNRDKMKLVTDLYLDKASSFLPEDIRRDRAECEEACGSDKAAGYGEIVLDHFIDMLDNYGAHAGQVFYDLGSGLGQLVFTAGLLGLDATGIEIVKQRHLMAVAAVEQAEKQGIGETHGSISHIHGSFYDVDFSNADIVFINSVMFSDGMMRILGEKARSMKHGSRIISYLGLPDAKRGEHQPADEPKGFVGTWFRRLKSINMRTTFSSSTPWKSYVVMREDRCTGAALARPEVSPQPDATIVS